MCTRNVGLRSLLYALEAGPMTIKQVSKQQLATHAELWWDPAEVTMAHQRTNWLRSLGLVKRIDTRYHLTAAGRAFVRDAVERHTTMAADDATMTADAAGARTRARVVDPEFRGTVLARYAHRCPVSGVDHDGLLEVAHVLSWADHPEYRADLGNVLPLSALHLATLEDRGICCERRPPLPAEPPVLRDWVRD
jgi:putative restriction endonuclease